MKLSTYKVANIHFALLKITGQLGGYIGQGRTVQQAIANAFTNAIINN